MILIAHHLSCPSTRNPAQNQNLLVQDILTCYIHRHNGNHDSNAI
jgi:hypothetical protein